MGVKALAGPVGKFDQINRTEVYTISPPDLTAAAELRALVERLLALADQIESDREMVSGAAHAQRHHPRRLRRAGRVMAGPLWGLEPEKRTNRAGNGADHQHVVMLTFKGTSSAKSPVGRVHPVPDLSAYRAVSPWPQGSYGLFTVITVPLLSVPGSWLAVEL